MGAQLAVGLKADAEPIGQQQQEIQELLHIHADIEMDGSSASITLQTTEGPIELHVTMEQMTAASIEIARAGLLMLRRRMKSPDKGRSAFDALMRSAPAPTKVIPMVDRQSGDVVIVYRFSDRLPQPVRLTLDQIHAAREVLEAEIKRVSN